MILGTEVEYRIYWRPDQRNCWALAPPLVSQKIITTIAESGVSSELTGARGPGECDFFLSNGGRVYFDDPFVEYATPECLDGIDAIACEMAGRELLKESATKVAKELGILIYIGMHRRAETEPRSGRHENYGIPNDEYFGSLFTNDYQPRPAVNNIIIPFLVSRIIWAGDGGYFTPKPVLSLRSLSVTATIGPTVTDWHLPMIRLPHHSRYETDRRLEVLCADYLEAPASVLALDITSVVVRATAQGILAGDLTLRSPIQALRSLSHNPRELIELADGRRFSAFDLQETIFDECRSHQNDINIGPGTPLEVKGDTLTGWGILLEDMRAFFRQ